MSLIPSSAPILVTDYQTLLLLWLLFMLPASRWPQWCHNHYTASSLLSYPSNAPLDSNLLPSFNCPFNIPPTKVIIQAKSLNCLPTAMYLHTDTHLPLPRVRLCQIALPIHSSAQSPHHWWSKSPLPTETHQAYIMRDTLWNGYHKLTGSTM